LRKGDVAVISNFAHSTVSGTPTTVTPDGFTNYFIAASAATPGGIARGVCYKVLDGTENTVTGMDSDIENWAVVVFRPNIPILTAVQGMSAAGASTTGNPSPSTITIGAAASLPALAVGCVASDGAIDPRTVDPAMTELSGSTSHYFFYKVYNPGEVPVNHTVDIDDEGTRNMIGVGYLTFTW